MEPAELDVLGLREQLFHERVRECLICTLLFASLYILCHFIITHFKKHADFTTGNRLGPHSWLWLPLLARDGCPRPPARPGSSALGLVLGGSSSSSPTSPWSSSCPSHISSPRLRASRDPRRYQLPGPSPPPPPPAVPPAPC
uniref:Uncharacterized protein n=1 Tax=Chelonoidis abingdonii TaxID=106734 RepID=A0A8C0GLZ0_CHEAB